MVGENGRTGGYNFASFHREVRKSTRALPATLPEAVQNGNLPEEPLGTIARKFNHFSPKEGSAILPWVPPCLPLGEIAESAHTKSIHHEVMNYESKTPYQSCILPGQSVTEGSACCVGRSSARYPHHADLSSAL